MIDLKKGQLTAKDMSVLREDESAKGQWKKPGGPLRDYTLNHIVRMYWQENIDRNLRPFALTIDNKRFILSWGELKELDSDGFFRRETDYKRRKLRRYDGNKITLSTELNEEAERDMMVHVSGEGFEVILDWYQVLRLGRFI